MYKRQTGIELNNVLIGEVWFTSGQSNMGWSIIEEKNAENILKNADHANIRLFHVPRHVSDRKESVFGKNAAVSYTHLDVYKRQI